MSLHQLARLQPFDRERDRYAPYPSAQNEVSELRALCSVRRRSQRSLKWTVCRFLANFLSPDALLWRLTHSSCAGGSRRLTERLFAGWLRRRTRKKSHGPYETLA